MSVLGRVTDPFDEEACKDYFIERYYNERQTTLQKGGKFRPHVLDCKDRSCKLPLLRSAAILPWILQDEKLFRMRALTAQLGSQPFFNLLWELYGTNPEILLQMHRCAEATKLNERLHEEKDLRLSFDMGPVVESSTISGALRNASLRDSGSGLASNESPSSALASSIRRQFVGLTQGDDYRSYFQSECFFYHEDGECIGRLRKGLTAIINEALPLLTKCQVQQSIARLPDIPSPRSIRSSILERMEKDNAGAHVLFSASGTGKTRHIFELLSKNWGFYLVADNYGDYDQRPGGLFLPQQSGASRDMHSFCSDLREIASLSRVTHRGYDLCEVLLATRLLVFFTAVKHKYYRSSGGSAGPMSWLWMQVNCTSKNDPFDTVYRLLRLQNSSGLRRTVTEQWSQSWQLFGGNYLWELLYSPPGQPNRLYVCIDEAQNILQTCEVVPGLMAAMMNMIYRRIPADHHPHSASVAIFSGTSLKLRAFNAELESWTDYLKRFGDLLPQSNAKTPSVDQSFDHSRFAIQTDFELIATNEDLENLWKTYVEGMIIETQDCRDVQPPHLLFRSGRRFDEDSWSALCGFRRKYTTDRARKRYNELFQHYSSQILEHGRPFRGRCRWSTLYIEELLRRIHQNDGIEPDMIRDAMEHAINEVKRGLGEQLHRLHESKERRQLESYQRTLLDDIYWASIMADLLNMPITLTSNEAEQAVTEGFAIVQHIEDKIQRTMVRIAEPLAVDAAVNYLHSKQPTYEAELWQHLLLSSQIDDESQSTFGKYSEYYFAWRLANFLRDNRKAEYIKSRRIFLRALGCAKLVPKRNRGDPSERHKDELYNSAPRLNSSDFNLTTFRLVRKSWTSLRGTKDHTAWLKSVEEKKQTSTFCFPQNKAGPDLLFVLNGEKDGKLTSVLCAMQFKVKKKVASNEYVESLVPSEKWLPTKWNLGPVVLILVSAAEDIDDDDFFKKGFGDVRNAKDLEEGGRLRDVDFYLCKIDRKFSQDLWGEVWMRLMVSMKKQEDLA